MQLIAGHTVAGFSALLTSVAMMMLVTAEDSAGRHAHHRAVDALSLIIGLPFVVAYAISETSTRH